MPSVPRNARLDLVNYGGLCRPWSGMESRHTQLCASFLQAVAQDLSSAVETSYPTDELSHPEYVNDDFRMFTFKVGGTGNSSCCCYYLLCHSSAPHTVFPVCSFNFLPWHRPCVSCLWCCLKSTYACGIPSKPTLFIALHVETPDRSWQLLQSINPNFVTVPCMRRRS